MPRNTRSSWGCVQKIGKDSFRLRWTEWQGRSKVRRSKTLHGVCRREADAEMHRLYELHHIPPWEREAPCPTFRQCWDEWYHPQIVKQREVGELSYNTVRNYENQWSAHIESKWGRTVMDKVDVDEYQTWLKGLSVSSARLSNITVGNMVNCAKLHGIKTITFKNIKYRMPKEKKMKETKRELEVYTLDELHDLIEQCRGKRYEAMVILMGKGSCRVGEAAAASLSDIEYVDYNGRVYAVYDLRRQYGYNAQGFIPLKNEFSVRPIVVPEPWSLRLREIAEDRRADGELYYTDSGKGVPYDRSTVNQLWREDFKHGRINARYLPMTKLRNSWATAMLWKYGVPAQMVDKMMGHASKNVLGRNYDRPDKQMFIEAVDRAYFG